MKRLDGLAVPPVVALGAGLALAAAALASQVHLRSGDAQEWATFPVEGARPRWTYQFEAAPNETEHALCLRQQDVKEGWRVRLGDETLGTLVRDENDMRTCLPVPPGLLRDENILIVEPTTASGASDDILVGDVTLHARPLLSLLTESTLDVTVVDADGGRPLPSRITIVDEAGTLMPTGTAPAMHLAVRPGVVYTATGSASVRLPAGTYTVYAGRGFEYSLAQTAVTLTSGGTAMRRLALRREVSMPGYVSSDPHIHTWTHSRHGDATVAERMVTIAGEGIELPIASDHNLHVDYDPVARAGGVRQHFTPIVGNEFTTPTAHFTVFPVAPDALPPDASSRDWLVSFDRIFGGGARIAVLNHPRDLHRGTRPFGPTLYNPVVGVNLDGWPMRFNAMEVVNSGAIQTDPLRVVHDWMGLLNHGHAVTPIGSSDSHDVTRYIVGQGRTYVRAEDRDVSAIDMHAAIGSVEAGRVLVSYGLVADVLVDGRYGPGDTVRGGEDDLLVHVRVLGPHWVTARHVGLYANGQLVREADIEPATRLPAGIKWQATWLLPRPRHDVHVVAVALGDGVSGAWWPTAKPYQPTSLKWQPYTLGVSGAIRVDADGDGLFSSARDYALRVHETTRGDLRAMLAALARFDAAVAAQAAHLYRQGGGSLDDAAVQSALASAAPQVRDGFRAYRDAWAENEAARMAPR